ncbi:MAG: hypothetical protein QM776_04525 [Rhodocyclaceae bacterium]
MKNLFKTALACLVLACSAHAVAATPIGIASKPVFPSNIEPQKDIVGCNWHASFIQTLSKESKGLVVPMSDEELINASRKLNVTVLKLFAPKLGGQKRRLGYRLEFLQDGKLVAFKEIEDRTLRDNEPVCALMSALATNLAKDTAEWLTVNRLPDCDKNCTGLHLEEPIAIGAQPIFPAPDFAASLGKCDWLNEVMQELSESLNDTVADKVKEKAKEGSDLGFIPFNTKVVTNNILEYTGRRLVLRFSKLDLRPANPQENASTELTAELHDGNMLVAAKRFSNDTVFHGSTLCKTMARLGDRAVGDVVKWMMKTPALPANWPQ